MLPFTCFVVKSFLLFALVSESALCKLSLINMESILVFAMNLGEAKTIFFETGFVYNPVSILCDDCMRESF